VSNAPSWDVRGGLALAVGRPRAGKTTAAIKIAAEWSRRLEWPVLIVDSVGGFAKLDNVLAAALGVCRRAERAADAVEAVVRHGQHALWTPRDGVSLDAALGAVAASRRGVVILVDELAVWIDSSRRDSKQLLPLMRTWFHHKVRMVATTQSLSTDLPSVIRACAPKLFLFGMPGDLPRRAAERMGMPPELAAQLATLEDGAHFALDFGGACTDLLSSTSRAPGSRSRQK